MLYHTDGKSEFVLYHKEVRQSLCCIIKRGVRVCAVSYRGEVRVCAVS